MSTDDIVLIDKHEGLATVTLNRPDQYNALSHEMLDALHEALNDLANDEYLRCVVLAANGRAFCAGHDLKQMRSQVDRDHYFELFQHCGRLMQRIVSLPVPVIARVHGTATAAGCQLVASCDLAVAADTAKFAVSGINVGLFCSTPAVALTRNVPIKKAFEMLVTGEFISAQDALAYGLVNRVTSADQLDAEVLGLVNTIRAKSPIAVRVGKSVYRKQLGMSLADAYEFTSHAMAENMMAQDVAEGIDAFMQKRTPVWIGR